MMYATYSSTSQIFRVILYALTNLVSDLFLVGIGLDLPYTLAPTNFLLLGVSYLDCLGP
jgi:hypothetical protein